MKKIRDVIEQYAERQNQIAQENLDEFRVMVRATNDRAKEFVAVFAEFVDKFNYYPGVDFDHNVAVESFEDEEDWMQESEEEYLERVKPKGDE